MRAPRGARNNRSEAYNAKGQITFEKTYTIRTLDTWTSETTFNYGSGSSYKLGAVVSTTGRTRKNQFAWVNTRTDNLYEYHGGASLKKITITPDTSQSETRTTIFTLDNIGTVTSAAISDGRARTVSFINDHAGQVIERKEQSGATNEPRELRYRFGGKEMGFTSNNGTLNTDYHASIADRTITPADNTSPGAFRHGSLVSTPHAEFDNSYAAINSYNQGSTSGSYTVRGGETLQSIAQQVYGDAHYPGGQPHAGAFGAP